MCDIDILVHIGIEMSHILCYNIFCGWAALKISQNGKYNCDEIIRGTSGNRKKLNTECYQAI